MGRIRIGYACVHTELPSASRTCRLDRASPERLIDLARQNLSALRDILAWNLEHDIRLFRISSGTIPFASHPVQQAPWWEILHPELEEIGTLIRSGEMRVSMHPGQYTVLNSDRPQVVENSIAELVYHARLLDAFGLDLQHKIVLHVGGSYGNQAASMDRFVKNFTQLPEPVARRLVLENDEKIYSLDDVLSVAQRTGSPVIFDIFHHGWKPSLPHLSVREIIVLVAQTWKTVDGPPKLHYSDQWPGKPPGSHAQSVDLKAFEMFYRQIQEFSLDIMLEVKDKQESVLTIQRELGIAPSGA